MAFTGKFVYIYIYIYIYRERERERETHTHTHTHTINLWTAARFALEGSSAQLSSNEDLEGPEFSDYW